MPDTLVLRGPSYTVINDDFLKSKLLSPNEKLCFIYLKMHSDKSSTCFPSLGRLAEESGLSKRTIQRALATLEDLGVISVKHRKDEKGFHSNIYTLYDNDRLWLAKDAQEIDASREWPEEKEEDIKKEPVSAATEEGSDETASMHIPRLADEWTLDKVKEYFHYTIVLENSHEADVDAVFKILYDTLTTSKTTLRIDQENKPAEVVKAQILKLGYEEIGFVIKKYNSVTEKIHAPSLYILSLLYHAKEQMALETTNTFRVNVEKATYTRSVVVGGQ